MSNELAILDPAIVSSLVLTGDLKKLTAGQKLAYYDHRCALAGLDPAAKPFDLLVLNGKEILYANAGGCQQLCSVHKLSTMITCREKVDDIYCVSARVTGLDGRTTENMGSVNLGGLRGEGLANAMMKATTKAIRRTVLSHVGLGMMDETEVDTVPGAVKVNMPGAKNIGFDPAPMFPLMMPNTKDGTNKLYSEHPTLEAWNEAWVAVLDRVEMSDKLSEEGKTSMVMQLKSANQGMLDKISVEFGNGA